jgi:hypothetical protein
VRLIDREVSGPSILRGLSEDAGLSSASGVAAHSGFPVDAGFCAERAIQVIYFC